MPDQIPGQARDDVAWDDVAWDDVAWDDVARHAEEEALLSIVEQRRVSEYGNSPHYSFFNIFFA